MVSHLVYHTGFQQLFKKGIIMFIFTYHVQYEGTTVKHFDTLEEAKAELESTKAMNCMGDYSRFHIYKAELLVDEN